MLCPSCKHHMIVVEYKQIELDHCPHCRGIWFDAGELEQTLTGVNLVPDGTAGKSVITLKEAATTEKKRSCPVCRKKMRKKFIGGEPEILIDACPDGQGLWFDGGEINSLLSRLSRGESSKEEFVLAFLKEVFGKLPDTR